MGISFLNANALEIRSLREAMKGTAHFMNGKVLDVGCGDRPYEEFFTGKYEAYIGIDLETVNASKADVFGDVLHLPFRAETFDTVLTTQVLEHVRNPFRMLQEVSTVLKRGGHLILSAPQAWPLHEQPYDYFRYTTYGLAELARASGLHVVDIKERNGGLYALGEILCILLYTRNQNVVLRRRLLKPFFWAVQIMVSIMDRILYLPEFTLGYVMIARKPE